MEASQDVRMQVPHPAEKKGKKEGEASAHG